MSNTTFKRDTAWLSATVESCIKTYTVQGEVEAEETAILQTIEREMDILFGAARTEAAEADLVYAPADRELGEGYEITSAGSNFAIHASSARGYLYGMFALHRMLVCGQNTELPVVSVPDQPIRMIDQWDNVDGSIERGYAGDSIFYDHNEFRGDLGLVQEYARLLAASGINAISINNVNVHKLETFFITDPALEEVRKIADVFGAYGIKLFLSINFAAPISIGGLDTADPVEQCVQDWWDQAVAHIYEVIPGFGGFVVKADSEGEPGPHAYGRTHADGANMLARALRPHGGIVIWRCFVYNCKQDWRDRSLDRANAAYDLFSELDGQFEDNVTLQIKNGPIDFQIREPVSPLFGRLHHTNQMLELQITQEYTGHQIDLCYLVPLWKEVLDFQTLYEGQSDVAHLLGDLSPVRAMTGMAAVSNIGMDHNWTGHKLAQANLYGFGRLAWDNSLSAEAIASEYVALAFSLAPADAAVLVDMLCGSRETYEDYTCPLAVGFMCRPGVHYGVDIDGYEYDRWGTYHYADRNGVGRERSLATGTGYTRRYSDARFEEYEHLETCPDELLLFLHHVSYEHVLHSGKTVIQHIYDTHFEGVERLAQTIAAFEGLQGRIPAEDYENIRERLDRQMANAIDWRDQVNTYFYRKSGVPDAQGRTIYE